MLMKSVNVMNADNQFQFFFFFSSVQSHRTHVSLLYFSIKICKQLPGFGDIITKRFISKRLLLIYRVL